MLIHLYVMIANDAIGTVLYHYSTTLLYIHYTVPISSVQSLGHVLLFVTPEPQHPRPLVHHHLLESTQTHVH